MSEIRKHLGTTPPPWQTEANAALYAMDADELMSDATFLAFVDPNDCDGEHTPQQRWRREHWRLRVLEMLMAGFERNEG